ncbi:hypothetical protein IAM_21332 [Escherichia coli XH001]|nr:hypothetical protein IAM_21332 [Escherichia coli XH001]
MKNKFQLFERKCFIDAGSKLPERGVHQLLGNARL